jgi:hypothetical protein
VSDSLLLHLGVLQGCYFTKAMALLSCTIIIGEWREWFTLFRSTVYPRTPPTP